MSLVDLGEMSAIARKNGLIICDNTFLSPYFQGPLEFGIDIVAHSTTRYINGHSDVVGGALIVSRADLAESIAYVQNALGSRGCKRSQGPRHPDRRNAFLPLFCRFCSLIA